MAILKTKKTLSSREGQLRSLDSILESVKEEELRISRAHEVLAIMAEELLRLDDTLSVYEKNAYVPTNIIEQLFDELTK